MRIIAGLTAMLLSGGAHAADLLQPPLSAFNWSGFYIGVGGGAGAVVHELNSPFLGGVALNGIGGEGVFGEVTIGYDHVFAERLLVGVFADARYGGIGTDLDIPDLALSGSIDAKYGFDVGLRLGYLVTPSTLGYVLGGYSWQRFDLSTSIPGIAYDWNADGFVVGAGLETVLSGNWTLKTEYRYAQYSGEDFGSGGLIVAKPSTHTVHAGLNYRFGAEGGAAASFQGPVYNWTGLHIGASVGAGGLVHDLDVPPLGGFGFNGIGAEGVFGEVSVGYDWEFGGGWVVGAMANARYSSVSTTLDVGPLVNASVDADWGYDILARFGRKLGDSTLVYALGGYSWQHFEVDISNPALGNVYDWGASGYSVGGGIETALSERTTLGLEYRYSAYSGEDFIAGLGGPAGLVDVSPSSHTVRLGLKVKLF
jgi:outer membrane immunogenic protein